MNRFIALNCGLCAARLRASTLGGGVGLGLGADEFVDAADAGAVGGAQILQRVVLVDPFEGADSVARDRDLVAANQGAIGGMPHANVRVLASEHHLVDAKLAELLIQARAVEGAIGALGEMSSRSPGCGSSSEITCAPGLPAIACSPHTFSSGSPGWWASLENTTTQPSRRACSRIRCSGATIARARGFASAPSTKSSSMSITTNAFTVHLPKPPDVAETNASAPDSSC